jgi:hypothetical protein
MPLRVSCLAAAYDALPPFLFQSGFEESFPKKNLAKQINHRIGHCWDPGMAQADDTKEHG